MFAVAVGLYLPTARYGFVQDDRGIVALNPAAHSLPAALRAVDDPYWPPPSEAGPKRNYSVKSRRVAPGKLLAAGFVFRHPHLLPAIEQLVA